MAGRRAIRDSYVRRNFAIVFVGAYVYEWLQGYGSSLSVTTGREGSRHLAVVALAKGGWLRKIVGGNQDGILTLGSLSRFRRCLVTATR